MLGFLRPSIALSFVIASACGPAQAPAASTPPSLEGHWASACTPSPQPDGSTQSIKLDFTNGKTDWKLDYVTFGDAACATRIVTVSIDGDYALTAPSATTAGAWEARFGFAHKTITPHVDGVANALTGAKCGTGTWKVGEAEDVLTGGCPAFGQYPKAQCAADFDLVRVDGNKLHFGDRPKDNDMCTAGKRPTALSALEIARL